MPSTLSPLRGKLTGADATLPDAFGAVQCRTPRRDYLSLPAFLPVGENSRRCLFLSDLPILPWGLL